MLNTIKTLIHSAVVLAALTFSAVAEPASQPKDSAEQPTTTITEILEVRERAEQPLVVQEDIPEVKEQQERPRGRSRADESRPATEERPLLEVHGF